jgi:hypothetical protein
MNASDERGSDSENFGARITEIGITVAKIWALEGFRGKMVFSKGFRGFSEILGVLGGSWHKRYGSCEVWEFFEDVWGIWSG